MNKAELKEIDREILQFWEGRVLLEKIEVQYPKARARIQGYKDRGIVGEGRVVNWGKFEEVDPPLIRGGIAKRNPPDNTGGIAQGNTKIIPGGSIPEIPGIVLSSDEVEILRELLGWWRSRKGAEAIQKGKRKAITFKIDEGLIEALKGASKREGKSQAEILSLSLWSYLRGSSQG